MRSHGFLDVTVGWQEGSKALHYGNAKSGSPNPQGKASNIDFELLHHAQ